MELVGKTESQLPRINSSFQRMIGITGVYGSGKTTVANVIKLLVGHKMIVFVNNFALGVKQVATQLGWDGNKDEKGRDLLQVVGTDIGRKYNEHIWVAKSHAIESQFLQQNRVMQPETLVIYDDLRFDNEALYVKHNEGIIIDVKDTVNEKDNQVLSHISERGIQDDFIDEWIDNNFKITDTVIEVKSILDRHGYECLQ